LPWTRSSSLARSLKCPASTVLPVYDERSQLARDAAEWGTLAHHWASTGDILDHPYARLLEKHIDECGIDRLALWPEDGRLPPTAFAIDCDSVTIQTSTSPPFDAWKAGFDDRFFCGEWDYARVTGPFAWLDDLKTGRPVDPDDPQIVSYAYGLWLDHDRQLNQIELSCTHWPRPNLYAKNPRAFKAPTRQSTLYTSADLEEFENLFLDTYRTRQDIAACDNPEDYANPGSWCTFCPARTFCPSGDQY
jgi:hypothetical protein